MSGPNRTPSRTSGRQAWTSDQVARGITCPACGLANEAGARVCRNCGLPIASADDPLRGVRPSRVEIVGASRSRVSATLGLALVVGLLLIGGSLAVSGGGILSGGGRLGMDPGASPVAGTGQGDPASSPGVVVAEDPSDPDDPGTPRDLGDDAGTSFDYTCDADAIRDLSKGRWQLSQFRVGERLTDDGNFDRITWELARRSRKSGPGTTVTMEWTTPDDARRDLGAGLASGQRAIVVTFDGPVAATVGQKVDELSMEPEGVVQVRTVDMFTGEDGKVRTVVGLRGDSCARMSAQNWTRKSTSKKNAAVYLDIEKE